MAATEYELNDIRVRELLNNPAVLKEFPQFKTAFAAAQKAKSGGSCRPCAARAKGIAAGLAAVKVAVLTLGPAGREKLKKLLGVASIKVYFKDASNKPTKTRI